MERMQEKNREMAFSRRDLVMKNSNNDNHVIDLLKKKDEQIAKLMQTIKEQQREFDHNRQELEEEIDRIDGNDAIIIKTQDDEIATLLEALEEMGKELSKVREELHAEKQRNEENETKLAIAKRELREEKKNNDALAKHAAKSALYAAEYKASLIQKQVEADDASDNCSGSYQEQQQQKQRVSLKNPLAIFYQRGSNKEITPTVERDNVSIDLNTSHSSLDSNTIPSFITNNDISVEGSEEQSVALSTPTSPQNRRILTRSNGQVSSFAKPAEGGNEGDQIATKAGLKFEIIKKRVEADVKTGSN